MIDPISNVPIGNSLSSPSSGGSSEHLVFNFARPLRSEEQPARHSAPLETVPDAAYMPTDDLPEPAPSAIARFRQAYSQQEAITEQAASAQAFNASLVSRLTSVAESGSSLGSRISPLMEVAPAASTRIHDSAPELTPSTTRAPVVTRETLAAAASSALATITAFADSTAPVFRDHGFPMQTTSDSPFATPPCIEAALARTPAAPTALATSIAPAATAAIGAPGEVPTRLASPDPSAIARFREAMSLHEDIQADFSKSVAALTAAATAALPPATLPVEATSEPPRVVPLSPPVIDKLAPVQSFTSSDGTVLPFRLYQPSSPRDKTAQAADAPSAIPLVLFLHGAGTRGSDGTALANNISFRSLLGWVQTHEPAIVLAPQCPADEKWVDTPWEAVQHDYAPVPPPHTAAALELLDQTLATLPADRSRIYVCGNSMGGYATWDALVRRPGFFAAALPVCGGGVPEKAVQASRDVPVWAFHGDADDVVPVENSRSMVAALRADASRTAEIRYREYPEVRHDCWTATFSDPQVLSWLFAQSRTDAPDIPRISPETSVRAAYQAVEKAIVDTIRTTPDIATHGVGDILIRLKPSVLDGSTVQISVSGNDLSVAFLPASTDAASVLQSHAAELSAMLAAKFPAWTPSVSVAKPLGQTLSSDKNED